MTTRPVQHTWFTLLKLQGWGYGTPENQQGKHYNQRQAAAQGWERWHLWGAGELEGAEEGLQKRDRTSGLPGRSQRLQGSSRTWERDGYHHHYGPRSGMVTITTMSWGSRMACLWILCQELLYKRDCTT